MTLNYLFYDKIVFGKEKVAPAIKSTITKNQNSQVSVIIPIYNTEKYLKKCLNSIMNQTHKNLEIILVDDGSTDNSGKIADDYAKKDKRIKVIHQKNQGQSTARNNGLKKATGDFVSFIDSDDEISKDFYQKHLATFNEDTAVSACGAHYKRLKLESSEDVYIDPLRARKKHESKKAYILYLLAMDGRMYWSVNKLFRTNVAKKCHFDKSLNFGEDTKFVLEYLKKSKGEIAFILEPLYIYNFGTETSTINKTATIWKNWQRQYQDLKSWLGKKPTLRERFWLSMVYARWHVSYYRSKKRAKQ
ncbi:glycosyltransferase family 2 protein [Candidatus Saccharibacteria bacterium]|nr:glycosyltransferase family 2 protein [Candidatus Saccharibacteria bacterium]